MTSASGTAVPFTIDSRTLAASIARSHAGSMLKFGTLVFLLGSVPVGVLETAPTAMRPPLPVVEALADRRSNYRRPPAIERGLARLKMFSAYRFDWDSAGASAPDQISLDSASLYLTALEPWHPLPLATLDRSGEPIIEFEDAEVGFFGSIRFLPNREVELYAKQEGRDSEFLVGQIGAAEVTRFLVDKMKLPTLQ
jgi:hypothetical protein